MGIEPVHLVDITPRDESIGPALIYELAWKCLHPPPSLSYSLPQGFPDCGAHSAGGA